jgi:undecaprenyl-diphosphatase
MAAWKGARANPGIGKVAEELGRTFAEVQRTQISPSEAEPRTRFALAVLFAGGAGFAVLAAVIPGRQLQAIDRAITVRLQAIHGRWIERAMTWVSWFGFPPQSRVLPAIYAGALWIARFRLEAVFQLAAWGSALLSTIVKSVVRRQRPAAGRDIRVADAPLGGSSFPSGHVLTYVGVYGWMALMADLLIRPPVLRRFAVAALTTLIAAVGPSRIYLGHHWPTDVAASYLLGSSYLAALLVAYRRLKSRRVLE